MLGALLLISHALCNQMLLIDQLAEHHNDHLDLKIPSKFLCKKIIVRRSTEFGIPLKQSVICLVKHNLEIFWHFGV